MHRSQTSANGFEFALFDSRKCKIAKYFIPLWKRKWHRMMRKTKMRDGNFPPEDSECEMELDGDDKIWNFSSISKMLKKTYQWRQRELFMEMGCGIKFPFQFDKKKFSWKFFDDNKKPFSGMNESTFVGVDFFSNPFPFMNNASKWNPATTLTSLNDNAWTIRIVLHSFSFLSAFLKLLAKHQERYVQERKSDLRVFNLKQKENKLSQGDYFLKVIDMREHQRER